jgi:hypothetical protein
MAGTKIYIQIVFAVQGGKTFCKWRISNTWQESYQNQGAKADHHQRR